MIELGRALAIARAGAFRQELAIAIELTLFSGQRRRPVATARLDEFVETPGNGGLWQMPALHRKTAANMGDDMDHVVPIPSPMWAKLRAQIQRAAALGSPFLFPASRLRRRGDDQSHMAAENLSNAFRWMPGVAMTPHKTRKAFGTHGERILRNTPDETASILDHSEGIPSGSVRRAYALHDGTHFKWDVMRRWATALEEACAAAISADPRLLDGAALTQQIEDAARAYRNRIGRNSTHTNLGGDDATD